MFRRREVEVCAYLELASLSTRQCGRGVDVPFFAMFSIFGIDR